MKKRHNTVTGFVHGTWDNTMATIADIRNDIFLNEAKPAFPTIVEQWCWAIYEVGVTTGKIKGKPISFHYVPRTKQAILELAATQREHVTRGKQFAIVYRGTMHGMASPAQFNAGEFTENAFTYDIPVYTDVDTF